MWCCKHTHKPKHHFCSFFSLFIIIIRFGCCFTGAIMGECVGKQFAFCGVRCKSWAAMCDWLHFRFLLRPSSKICTLDTFRIAHTQSHSLAPARSLTHMVQMKSSKHILQQALASHVTQTIHEFLLFVTVTFEWICSLQNLDNLNWRRHIGHSDCHIFKRMDSIYSIGFLLWQIYQALDRLCCFDNLFKSVFVREYFFIRNMSFRFATLYFTWSIKKNAFVFSKTKTFFSTI